MVAGHANTDENIYKKLTRNDLLYRPKTRWKNINLEKDTRLQMDENVNMGRRKTEKLGIMDRRAAEKNK